jgi:hypothetical protein
MTRLTNKKTEYSTLEIVSVLNLGVTEREIDLSSLQSAEIVDGKISFLFTSGLFLSMNLELDNHKEIKGISNLYSNFDRYPFESNGDYVNYGGTTRRVLFDDDDKGVDDGVNIHITGLIRHIMTMWVS